MGLQFDDAQKLSEKRENKPCNHPSITKEYFKGSSTGDYVCTTCGATGTREYLESKRESNKQK